jgi:guanylate kinase
MFMVVAPTHAAGRRGIMFVLSSPSGAGKTTLSHRLLQEERGITLSISVTTRPMREGEVHGRDYYFVSLEKFTAMVEAGDLLEHALVFDHYYGTPKQHVMGALARGEDVLFDIDWQGTRQLKQRCRDDLISVFILPPSLNELERRLRARAQDSDEVVRHRMSKAAHEISHWEEYDYVVVNENLEEALKSVRAILHGERLKRERQPYLAGFIEVLCGDNIASVNQL